MNADGKAEMMVMTNPSKNNQKDNNAPNTVRTDIKMTGLWQALPLRFHPYISLMRLDRPIGWWLLLLPGWWAILLTADDLMAALQLMVLFMIGAISMRAAGCVINDMWDRDIDRKIARTATRPLASGEISAAQAWLTLFILGAIGLLVLLALPVKAWLMGMAALPFVALYPAFKRFTYWPQAMLGLTFSWGIFLGHVAATNGWPDMTMVTLYLGTVFWVIGYDTIYAIQDMADDEKTGVKSSARALKGKIARSVKFIYLIAILLLSTALFWHFGKWSYWTIGIIIMALHLLHQANQIDEDDPVIALRLFKSNRNAGLWLVAGLLLERLL